MKEKNGQGQGVQTHHPRGGEQKCLCRISVLLLETHLKLYTF